ncbi:hypothetical protein [Providencia alcalifaciens]|uniref:hypothetical protein n=1 Tax=Providencia alcalifaciens TaxID=126385 RepID=UPI003D292755
MQGTNLTELKKAYRYQTLALVNRTLSNMKNKNTSIFVAECRKRRDKIIPRGRVLKKLKGIHMAFLRNRYDEQCMDITVIQNEVD